MEFFRSRGFHAHQQWFAHWTALQLAPKVHQTPITVSATVDQPTRFIGMDVHKDTIVVAVTTAGDLAKATPYGTFPNTAAALEKLVKRLRQASSGLLKFCYEAGPCGYGVHRVLSALAPQRA
jgi:hypothetical protein